MIKLLAIGDSHIPRRANNIPDQICATLKDLIQKSKFDYTFFTGDVIQAPNWLSFLKINTQNDFFKVLGNMDYYGGNRDTPLHQVLSLALAGNDKITIGLTHGHQISPRGDHNQLTLLAREKGYNIMISGHTHKEEIFLSEDGILLINPGSITGAWSFIASGNPSFAMLLIDESKINIEVNLFQSGRKFNATNKLTYSFIFSDNRVKRNR